MILVLCRRFHFLEMARAIPPTPHAPQRGTLPLHHQDIESNYHSLESVPA